MLGTLALLFLLSPNALAEKMKTIKYDLNIELTLNGKKISTSQLIVENGKNATFEEKTSDAENSIAVIATEGNDKNTILMNFTFKHSGKNSVRKISADKQIIALENKTTEIILNDQKDEKLMLSVIGKRVL